MEVEVSNKGRVGAFINNKITKVIDNDLNLNIDTKQDNVILIDNEINNNLLT